MYNYKTFLIFCLGLITLASCNDDDDDPSVDRSLLISTDWQGTTATTVSTTSIQGLGEQTDTETTDISDGVLEFREDGTYVAYNVNPDDGSLEELGTNVWTLEGNRLTLVGSSDLGVGTGDVDDLPIDLEGLDIPEEYTVLQLSENELVLFTEFSGDVLGFPVEADITLNFNSR
ncbi:MAG: lipocalin family protein [Thermonemataceae bacterium]